MFHFERFLYQDAEKYVSFRQALVQEHGREGTFSVRFTASGPLDLASRPEEQFSQLRAAVLECQTKGAEAVIVAGGPSA